MNRLVPVALTVALVLAGCAQFGIGETPEPETPVTVPESNDSLAGIGDEEINPVAVSQAHADAAAASNYTMRVRQRTVRPDGTTLREMVRNREVARGGRSYAGSVRYNVSVEVLREFGTTDYWKNRTHVATRFDSPLRQPQTGIWESESGGPIAAPSNSRHLEAFLRASTPTVETRAENGSVVLAGSETYPNGEFEIPPRLRDPRSVSARFRVDSDGRVVSWRVAYDATFERQTVRVVRTGELLAIGETVVERPDWVDSATSLGPE